MHKRWHYNIFIFVLLLLNILVSFAGCRIKSEERPDKSEKTQRLPLEVEVKVDKPVAEVGDIIKYTLTVNAIPEINPDIPEVGSSIHGLRIINMGSKGPSEIDRRKVWERWYEMEADIVGSYIIPEVTITYEDAEGKEYEATTAQIFIEIKSRLTDDPNNQVYSDIRDIHSLENIKANHSIYVWGGIVGAILVIVTIVFFWKKRGKEDEPIIRPAHEIALEALENLGATNLLDEGNLRVFYFKLSEIFRQYLEARYRYPAAEKTTEELTPFLEKLSVGREFKDKTRSLMQRADMAKFAKSDPPCAIAKEDWQRVEEFVNETAERMSEEN
ncbi:MAG: hypothetical protein ACMUIP_05270 [bacterium]